MLKCTHCSKGCRLKITNGEGQVVQVDGASCHRGIEHGLAQAAAGMTASEFARFKSFVAVKNGYMKHLLVISDSEISITHFNKVEEELRKITLEAPIEKGQKIYLDEADPTIVIVACRSMKKRI